MFFYLSFLRPPPLHSPTFGTISITPQIANDLRTESLESPQDIYYQWTQCIPSSSSKITDPSTKPTKLTTWRPSSAYKEIPVPLPRGIRDGQSWRLILTTQSTGGRVYDIDLHQETLGQIALPVISMPIAFGSRNPKAATGGKQEKVDRVYCLRVGGGSDSESVPANVSLKVTEQTSFDLDKKIWDSGLGLSSWLARLACGSLDAGDLKDVLFSPDPRNILELGAGTGIVSLVLAAIRNALVHPEGEGCIITTDLPSAMPVIEHGISENHHLFPAVSPEARVLDWDDEVLPDYITNKNGFDAIIMADVTYNTDSFPSLVRTLSSLIRLGPKPPAILLGYKERHPAERSLWDMARQIGIVFERIGEHAGAGGAPVEVWLGSVQAS